ncbi:hypothetical protein C8Q75DRAFT_734977 [Abortiporus biennis]|nr:hypothetical protein C8Q75DRAFT_734977 [Abortiporus biennis]
MLHNEHEEVTKDYQEELKDIHETKAVGIHNVSLACHNDASTSLDSVICQLEEIRIRIGMSIALFACHDNFSGITKPHVYTSSPTLDMFFETVMKHGTEDIAMMMEAYNCSGITDTWHLFTHSVIRNYQYITINLKGAMKELINLKLEDEIMHLNKVKINYKSFSHAITAKYAVVVNGWLLKKFLCSGDINSRIDLRILYHAWNNGTAKFYKLTPAEFEEWENTHYEALTMESEPSVTPEPLVTSETRSSPMSLPSTPPMTPPPTAVPSRHQPSVASVAPSHHTPKVVAPLTPSATITSMAPPPSSQLEMMGCFRVDTGETGHHKGKGKGKGKKENGN